MSMVSSTPMAAIAALAAGLLSAGSSWAAAPDPTGISCANFDVSINGAALSFVENANCQGIDSSDSGSPKAEDVPLSMLGKTWLYGYTDTAGSVGSSLDWAFDGAKVSNTNATVTFAMATPANSLIGLKLGNFAGYWLFTGAFSAGDTVTFDWADTGWDTGSGLSHSTLYTTAPIPEPSTYALMAAGLAAVGFVARRRRPIAAA